MKTLGQIGHNPDCDVNDQNIEGIEKPCNCRMKTLGQIATLVKIFLVSSCCHAKVRFTAPWSPNWYECTKCHKGCEAVLPEKKPLNPDENPRLNNDNV